jgi:hypothetical protein
MTYPLRIAAVLFVLACGFMAGRIYEQDAEFHRVMDDINCTRIGGAMSNGRCLTKENAR